jgi:hypothetical protein
MGVASNVEMVLREQPSSVYWSSPASNRKQRAAGTVAYRTSHHQRQHHKAFFYLHILNGSRFRQVLSRLSFFSKSKV